MCTHRTEEGHQVTILEFDIPMLPPTPNKTRGQHWAKAHRIREDAGWAVTKAWMDCPNRETTLRIRAPAVINATICSSGRPGDEDNQWARLKPIIDAMTERGILVDDSPQWLTLGTITHAKAPPKKGHVVIRITYHEEPA